MKPVELKPVEEAMKDISDCYKEESELTKDPVKEELSTEELLEIKAAKNLQSDRIDTVSRLKDNGFEKAEGGCYTFKSANTKPVPVPKELIEEYGDLADLPPPKMTIAPITATGDIQVNFDQDMIYPQEIDQKVYDDVFEVSITSALDGSISYGRFGNKTEERMLEEAADNLSFTVEVTEHSSKKIQMKTWFDDPSSVSSLSSDVMSLLVKEVDLFRSAYAGQKTVGGDSFEGKLPIMKK